MVACGKASLVGLPAADRTSTGIEQHFGWKETMASGTHWSMHSVAVAAANADPLHLHMPVVAAAMLLIQANDLIWLGCIASGKQQQLNFGGLGCRHRKIHTAFDQAAA